MSTINPLDYTLIFPKPRFKGKRVLITGCANYPTATRAMIATYSLLKFNGIEAEMTFTPVTEGKDFNDNIGLLFHNWEKDQPVSVNSIEIMTSKQFQHYSNHHFEKGDLWSTHSPFLDHGSLKTPGWEYFKVVTIKLPQILLAVAPTELGLTDAVIELLSGVINPTPSTKGWGRLLLG